MPENSARKPPTDFTIDCILSKSDSQNGDIPKSPTIHHPMNKVLDNPWISKCPLALTYKPSLHRKLSFPSSSIASASALHDFNFYNPLNYSESFLKVTQHFTSVHNHFYPASTSSSSAISGDHKLLPKSIVYENKNCDSEILRNNLSLKLCDKRVVKNEPTTPTTPNASVKCSVCSKCFENSELLDVRLILKFLCSD